MIPHVSVLVVSPPFLIVSGAGVGSSLPRPLPNHQVPVDPRAWYGYEKQNHLCLGQQRYGDADYSPRPTIPDASRIPLRNIGPDSVRFFRGVDSATSLLAFDFCQCRVA
jgi:hypothetical protein